LTVREEHKLRVFENRVLRRIFGGDTFLRNVGFARDTLCHFREDGIVQVMAVKISDLTYWLVSVLKYTYGLADVIFP
jgi:hypothetical protein